MPFVRRTLVAAAALLGALVAAPVSAQDEAQVKSTHGDWEVRCRDDGACYMSQLVRIENNAEILFMAIRKLAQPVQIEGRTIIAESEIRGRLGVFLPAGLTMFIDGEQVARVPFEYCSPNGCSSRIQLTSEGVTQLKKGGVARFQMVFNPTTPRLEATVSLTGFTAAYDSM